MISYNVQALSFHALVIFYVACCSEKVVAEDIPADMEAIVTEKRRELIETVSEVDDKLADAFLSEEPISSSDLEVRTKMINLKKKKGKCYQITICNILFLILFSLFFLLPL